MYNINTNTNTNNINKHVLTVGTLKKATFTEIKGKIELNLSKNISNTMSWHELADAVKQALLNQYVL